MLGVGPVRGNFDADVGLFDLDEPRSAVLRGNLSGALGAASGEGRLRLTSQDADAALTIRYNIRLFGPGRDDRWTNARWRRRAILIDEFFRRFAVALAPAGTAVAPRLRKRTVSRSSSEQGNEASRISTTRGAKPRTRRSHALRAMGTRPASLPAVSR